MKNMLSLVLALCMIISIIPIGIGSVYAEGDSATQTDPNLIYSLGLTINQDDSVSFSDESGKGYVTEQALGTDTTKNQANVGHGKIAHSGQPYLTFASYDETNGWQNFNSRLRVTFDTEKIIPANENLTIETWVRGTYVGSTSNHYDKLFQFAANQYQIGCEVGVVDGAFQWYEREGTGSEADANYSASSNISGNHTKWTHYTFTRKWDENESKWAIEFYVDGKKLGSTVYVANVTAKKEYDSSYGKLAIGGNWARYDSHVGGSFGGDIATFNVYNTALDSTTIASKYAATVGNFVENTENPGENPGENPEENPEEDLIPRPENLIFDMDLSDCTEETLAIKDQYGNTTVNAITYGIGTSATRHFPVYNEEDGIPYLTFAHRGEDGKFVNGKSQLVVELKEAIADKENLTFEFWLRDTGADMNYYKSIFSLEATSGRPDTGLEAFSLQINDPKGHMDFYPARRKDHDDFNGVNPFGSVLKYHNKWTHYVITRVKKNGAWTSRLYINGKAHGTEQSFTPVTTTAYGDTYKYLIIGGNPEWSAEGAFPGDIADFKVWDKALTAQEAKANYETELPIYKSGANVRFRGIYVNDNQYLENMAIPASGTTTVKAIVENNTDTDATYTLIGAVIGNQLHSIDIEKELTVPANSEKYVSLDLEIPEGGLDANINLMLWESAGNIMPLCNIRQKIVKETFAMPHIFSNNMVLQRGEKTNIFGYAPSGSTVTVTFGAEGDEKNYQVKTAIAKNGEFLVQLENLVADATEKTLTVAVDGYDPISFTGVVVGDVYYGSGQSNMEYTNKQTGITPDVIANARMFNVTYSRNLATTIVSPKKWTKIETSSNVNSASAMLYALVSKLRELGAVEDDVPLGIVRCAISGSTIRYWIDTDAVENIDWCKTNYLDDYYNEIPYSESGSRVTDCYYGMAKSVLPYSFKAALWYQGESDSDIPGDNYSIIATHMINTMRNAFGYDIPYFVMNLAGYSKNDCGDWSAIRLQLQKLGEIDGVYPVIINDTGGKLHPKDKDVVGERVARRIMNKLDGKTSVANIGPEFESATLVNGEVTITLDNVNDGVHGGLTSLAEDGTALPGFELHQDGEWTDATAEIVGDTVVLSASGVTNPTKVRYAYQTDFVKSVGTTSTDSYGTIKLPLAPFVEDIK